MGRFGGWLKNYAEGSSQYLMEHDDSRFTRHSSSIVGTIMMGVSLVAHFVDMLTLCFCYVSLVDSFSGHAGKAGFEQQNQLTGWGVGIFGTVMTYAMFFGISSYYSNHRSRVTNSALGSSGVKFAKRMDTMSMLFKELTHNFPYIVAIFSISTTAYGFWLAWDVQSNYWGAAALALGLGIIVYYAGPYLFLKSFHLWEHSGHEEFLDNHRDYNEEILLAKIRPDDTTSNRAAVSAPPQQRAIAPPRPQPQQRPAGILARASAGQGPQANANANANANTPPFRTKHPAGKLSNTSIPVPVAVGGNGSDDEDEPFIP